MRRRVFAIVGFCFFCSAMAQAGEEQFNEIRCELVPSLPEIYVISLEAPNRTAKDLWFNNNAENGFLTFHSTSWKYGKWASDLSSFDNLNYRATGRDVGVLSVRRKDPQRVIDFGIISKECWDGLRQHVKGVIRSTETAQE